MKILPILLLACISVFGQKASKDTLIRYFNAQLEPCKKKELVFIGVVIRHVNGWNGIIYDDSTRVIMRGRYLNEDCLVKDGWFVYYFPNGKRSLSGKFEQNIRQGIWMRWYPSGQIRDSLHFINNLTHGQSYSWFENGRPESEGIYKQGKYDSLWTFFHDNGNIATREKYEDGKLADLECFDTTGNLTGISCALQRAPEIKGKYGGFHKYIEDSIVYPPAAQKKQIKGIVRLEFIVTKNGVVKDVGKRTDPQRLSISLNKYLASIMQANKIMILR